MLGSGRFWILRVWIPRGRLLQDVGMVLKRKNKRDVAQNALRVLALQITFGAWRNWWDY